MTTLITAHGGSLNTGRNSQRYFDTIKAYSVDIIEVDIWKRGDLLYLSHLPKIFGAKKCISLSYAFDFIKKYDYKINCDVKMKNLVKDVLALAREKDVVEKIIFTGSVKEVDFPYLTEGVAYLNKSFFDIGVAPGNMQKFLDKIRSYKNKNIIGINFNYKYLTDDVLEECKKIGLPVSTFTVDDIKDLERLSKFTFLDNVTTNIPDKALLLYGREIRR